MRRFVTLAILLLVTIPFGASISGCAKKTSVVYCNGSDSGVTVGQVTTLTLQPRLNGISINQGQLGQVGTPSATDCKGNSAGANNFVYGTTDMFLADINPSTGQICAGSWNRNSGAGVADFTTCTFTSTANGGKNPQFGGTAYVTASADGVVSNPIAVYVHEPVTSIFLGPPSSDCATDPASNCVLDATQTNGCSTAAVPTNPSPAFYTGNACVSQGSLSQLAARAYKNTGNPNPLNNISCRVGPLTFSPQTAAIATVTQAGVVTAVQPGTTIINATTSQSSSSAGLYSVCPPASISLNIANSTSTSATVNQNVAQNLTATVLDTLGVPMNNLTLEYVSTTPTTIAANGATITPTFPGSAAITALCQPPACNPSPINQIGLFGNGKTVLSNPVQITSPGTNSTVLYVGSTNSQYLVPVDFTGNNLGSPVRLPYAPNSMVISQDLSSIYMGTTTELMVVAAATSTLAREDTTVAGSVLSVSPDSSTVVITDPNRKLIYLYSSSGSIAAEIGGIGTRAAWTPDSNTVYITTSTDQLVVHSAFLGWQTVPDTSVDVTVTIPSHGAYFAGSPTIARTSCPVTTTNGAAGSQTTTRLYYQQSDTAAVATDRVVAANNGKHILGATVTGSPKFVDLTVQVPNPAATSCPLSGALQRFSNSPATTALGVPATSINQVLVTSDSAYSFVTYGNTAATSSTIATVPQYAVGTSTLTQVPLTGSPTIATAGVLSADDQTFYVGTAGDNLVHILTRGTAGFTDTKTIAPLLNSLTGGIATPNLLVQRPKKAIN